MTSLAPTAVRAWADGVAVLSTGDVRIPLYPSGNVGPRLADQRYRGAAGEPALRAAVAAASGVDAGQLVVTPGARQALLLAFATLPADRREILLTAPYWASYAPLAQAVGVQLTVVSDLRAAVGPATGAVLVNSPRNPDGAVRSAAEVAELVEWTAAAGVRLIFDQVYRSVPLPGSPPPSPLDAGELPAHCLVVDGLSKSHALAGLRIGWLIGHPSLLAPASGLASHLIGGTSSAAQDVALAALGRPEADRRRVGAQLTANRDYGVARLSAVPGVECPTPAGGIFLFPAVPARPDLIGWLEREHAVAVVDGAAFGAPGHIRLSYGVEVEQFRVGVDRLAAALESG